jgi:hypothetical protein
MQLFTYVRQCLATEMRLVQASNGEALSGIANLMITNSGAEVLHKIDVLRRRTQVSGVERPVLGCLTGFGL